MIVCYPRHPIHLCQDPESISRTFLEQFALVKSPLITSFIFTIQPSRHGPSVFLSFCLFVSPSISLSVFLSFVFLFIMSFCLSVFLSLIYYYNWLACNWVFQTFLSFHLSVFSYFCLFVFLSFSLFLFLTPGLSVILGHLKSLYWRSTQINQSWEVVFYAVCGWDGYHT